MHNPCIYVCLARGQAIFSLSESQLLLALYLHKSRDIVILKGSRAYRAHCNCSRRQVLVPASSTFWRVSQNISKATASSNEKNSSRSTRQNLDSPGIQRHLGRVQGYLARAGSPSTASLPVRLTRQGDIGTELGRTGPPLTGPCAPVGI